MNIMNMNSLSMAGGLIILVTGLVAVVVSITRIKKKDFTLLNFGIFFSLYGLRWLVEIPGIEHAISLLMPHFMPYLHSFLTYLIPIPFAAFLLNVIGRGLYSSMLWFFISTILYAIGAMIYDFFSTGGTLTPSISTIVLGIWCMIGGINIILIQAQDNTELKVLKITMYLFFFCLAYDNLVIMNALPWRYRLEHIDIFVLFVGMVYVVIRRFSASNETSYIDYNSNSN